MSDARPDRDDLGLSVDMLDVDRLRVWATNVETYGSELSQWGSPGFVVAWLRGLAARLETTVRDIGQLRAGVAAAAARPPIEFDALQRYSIESRWTDHLEFQNRDVYRLVGVPDPEGEWYKVADVAASRPRPQEGQDLSPRARAEKALTLTARHHDKSEAVRLSGLTFAGVEWDLAAIVAEAIADAERDAYAAGLAASPPPQEPDK
jgi:hypothetical protein